jgi:uncharacterized metal-binding protein
MDGSKSTMVIAIETIEKSCGLCEDYARSQESKPIAVLCCEGACLRGEVARRAANLLCFALAPELTARICLGSAFTKDAGQRRLVEKATKALVLEGCFLRCASRMMAGAAKNPMLETVIVDGLYDFDHSLFGCDQVADHTIDTFAREAAGKVLDSITARQGTWRSDRTL